MYAVSDGESNGKLHCKKERWVS